MSQDLFVSCILHTCECICTLCKLMAWVCVLGVDSVARHVRRARARDSLCWLAAGRWSPLAGTPSRCSYLWCTLRLSTGHVCMHHYDICESSDGLSLRYVCSVAATVPVSKAKAKMDIHVVDSGFGALGHSSRWLGRACVRAWFLSPHPQSGRRRILSGRKDVA